ncbi:MAG: hypothetical protein AWU54_315 [Candidatus Frackibacter sp. T328-2]|nr:MAG: hypothetical protein AWU54_315 [Candidatus Frackibacter sp. T328-2]
MGRMYSEEELLEALKQKAKELGRTPKSKEVKKDYMMPSVNTYQSRFGTYNNALEKAGLKFNEKSFSKQKLLKMLKIKAKELGKTPTKEDINNDKRMASSATYYNKFESYTEACRKAGLEPNSIGGNHKRIS